MGQTGLLSLSVRANSDATVSKLQGMGREFIRARSNRALYFFGYDDHVFELDTEDIDKELGG